MSNSSIWLIDRTQSGATILGQNGPRSDGNKRLLYIHQSCGIAGASPSDCLISYQGHSLVEGFAPLRRYSQCILQPRPTGLTKWWFRYLHSAPYFIIIMSHCQHSSPWHTLATRLYRSSLPRGHLGYILYWHRAVVYRF